MRLAVAIVLILVLGCGKSTTSSYLQENQISLVKPMVTVSSTVIDSTVVLTVKPSVEGASIRYTVDGSEPTKESALYSNPIITDREGVYQFKAFHTSWKPSEITSVKLYKKGMAPQRITWHTNVHKTYPGIGSSTVINEKKGALNFRDTQWVGFDTIASATVYFEEKTFVKTLTLGYLIDTKSWIFPPTEVHVTIDNGHTGILSIDEQFDTDIKKMDDVILPIGKSLDSITITVKNLKSLPDWHPGSGHKAWLFMDEWIFN